MESTDRLLSISPIDGRYFDVTQPLKTYFSEYAYLKTGIEIEIKYLIFLSRIKIFRRLTTKERDLLKNIYSEFTIQKAIDLKEKGARDGLRIHDLKSIEYFIKRSLQGISLSDITQWVHFGLTSYDIVENSYRMSIKKALKKIIVPEITSLSSLINQIAKRYLNLPMLGRTHGQPAVPTTLGKELAVFSERLHKELVKLKGLKLYGKFGGAVGNWNALNFTFPERNWVKLSTSFLKTLELEHSKVTTQVAPPEDLIEIFQTLQRINSILIDFNQDLWRYISDSWIVQKGKTELVGSSTMPQKVNPLEFENSEGNLILANGLFDTISRKLPISRLQRDLSDSTVSRNIGVAFAHSLIAYNSCGKGLTTLEPNKIKISGDLNEDWSILSEALQTVLRKNGKEDAYEKISAEVRGKTITSSKWIEIVNSTDLPKEDKEKLVNLKPEDYLGIVHKKW